MGLFDDLIPQADSFRSTPRPMTVDDVQAAVRGDMFNSPGLPVSYTAQPGQMYGRDATANAQPFQNIVSHHTATPTLEGAINYSRKGTSNPLTGERYFTGYHFLIDKDGSISQNAPLDARTNHVQAPGAPSRTSRPDVSNNNSVGISFVGMGEQPTPQQLAAAENLSRSLMDRYGIQPQNVVGHGQVQNNRMASEGMPLVNAIQGQPQQPLAVAQGPRLDLQSTAQAQPAAQPKSLGLFDDITVPKADIGRGRALAAGLRSGVTANFGDEVSGAAAAGTAGTSFNSGRLPLAVTAPIGVARMLYEKFQGQPGDATQAYEKERDRVRAEQQAAQEQYPGTYMAGNVGGGVMLPGGAALNAATLPARIGRGAVVGAGYGALSGAGEGTTAEDRASRAAVGGVAGATIGAVAPPLVEGAIQGGRALVNPVVNAVRGAVNPETEAARRVVTALERDARAGQGGLTPQQFRAETQAGSPVTIMDMGGETTRALARSAANTSPEGRQALNQTINDRFEGQAGRVSDWFRNTFNFPNARAQQEAIDATERTVNRAAYGRAYHDGNRTLTSPGLDELSQSPAVQDAMRAATRSARDRAASAGQTGGTPLPNNLQFWDYTRRELTDAASAARRAGRNEEASRLGQLATALNRELDSLVPSYQQARAGAARFFGAENALEAGQNFVRQNLANPEARRALAQMTPQERQLFQDGFVSRYIEMLGATGDRRNVLNQIANSPQAREKLQIALGPQRSAELEARLRVEGVMDLARGAVQGNSTTARQLAELGFAGGAGSLGAYGAWNQDPAQMTYAAVAGALLAGRRGIDQRVSRQVAHMLTSDNPQLVQRGIQIVARNGRMMDALRNADRRIAVVGGGQAPTSAVAQVPAVTRADE